MPAEVPLPVVELPEPALDAPLDCAIRAPGVNSASAMASDPTMPVFFVFMTHLIGFGVSLCFWSLVTRLNRGCGLQCLSLRRGGCQPSLSDDFLVDPPADHVQMLSFVSQSPAEALG